jgi:hypothetical protein
MADTMTPNWNQRESQKAEGYTSAIGAKADNAAHAVGSGVKSLADTIRHHGPEEGVLGDAKFRTARALDQAGHYLSDQGMTGMTNDIANCIRRNPVPALLVGLGLGFVLAHVTRRR